jgi:DNA-binding MarR family transcriptional regulator
MMDGETMSDNSFFKPTLLYKEFMILDLIEKDANITQREISKIIGVAVSMTNAYIENFVKKGLIKKKKHSTKTVEYFVTKKGVERKKVLNISYLNASLNIYKSAKENIVEFLDQIIAKGYKNILLYGAGEVAEILLQTILIDSQIPINVLAVIDDDKSKQGKTLVNTKIISLDSIYDYIFDGILISSYTNQKLILNKLLAMNYQKENILHFFD